MSGIQQLQEAEAHARDIVKNAKKQKAELMQKSRELATKDIEKFKKDREVILAEMRSKTTSDESFRGHLQRQLDSITGDLSKQFDHDSEKVITALLEGVMTVNVSVPRARIRD